MLLSLHVKNLALIEEEEVTFTDGPQATTGLLFPQWEGAPATLLWQSATPTISL